MMKLSKAEEAAILKNLIYVSIISADNDKYSEEIKQEIIQRHKIASDEFNDPTDPNIDWGYVFAPLGEVADKYGNTMIS